MTTNSMLFEGPDLEAVLHEAQLCFGPDVEIEAANRVRRGGILGFFASEWYEVWARPPAVATNPALRQLDMEPEHAPDSFQQMVQNALHDRQGGVAAAVDPRLEYETAMDQFFDTPPDHGGAGRTLVGAGAPVAAAPAPVAAPAPAVVPAAAPTAAPVATAAQPAAPADQATPTMNLLAAEPIPAAVALEDPPRGQSVFEESKPAKTELLWAMLDRLDDVPIAPDLAVDSGLVVFVGEAARALETARRVAARDDRWAGVVAVVSRHSSLEDVPDWLLVDNLEEAVSRTDRWRQRPGFVPVVIDQSIDGFDRAWAAEVVTALRADQVRMITEAWRLPTDVGALAAKLGGVDALDLVAVSDSIEPLAMLDLEIPIATVEGRTASPELLAAVWLENRRAG